MTGVYYLHALIYIWNNSFELYHYILGDGIIYMVDIIYWKNPCPDNIRVNDVPLKAQKDLIMWNPVGGFIPA